MRSLFYRLEMVSETVNGSPTQLLPLFWCLKGEDLSDAMHCHVFFFFNYICNLLFGIYCQKTTSCRNMCSLIKQQQSLIKEQTAWQKCVSYAEWRTQLTWSGIAIVMFQVLLFSLHKPSFNATQLPVWWLWSGNLITSPLSLTPFKWFPDTCDGKAKPLTCNMWPLHHLPFSLASSFPIA